MAPFVAPRALAILVALLLPLGGCVNFDPVEWLAGDWLNNKKPLPGERRELFPGGVPGVSKGVPPDLVKGNQAAALQQQEEGEADASPVRLPEEPKPKPKAKPKPKPKVVQETAPPERPPTAVTVRPQGAPASQPQVQWPDPPATAPRPQPQVQWPDPPAPR
ncbi:MAG: hypothetical protein IT536_10255 [Hyphomicrobiales bacterium]|nr:hypothetical protein [Hyphomicrobiales bacterium]